MAEDEGPLRQHNVQCSDEVWATMQTLAKRSRRSTAAEVRVALDVYTALVERDGPMAVEAVLNGKGQ